MTVTKNIYIIRHGETEYNKLNIVQGSGVDTDLNETGRKQASLFYESFGNHPFDKVYTSSLQRSQQSVAAFIQKGIPHLALSELNEISWGDFEGKAQSEEERTVYWKMIERWAQGDLDAKIPNGESPFEMQLRQKRALDKIMSGPEQEILICMHGRAMKSFLCLILNEPLTQMEKFQHRNLCLYQVQISPSSRLLIKGNDTSHLSPKSA
jgi:phosphoserine phosphatase